MTPSIGKKLSLFIATTVLLTAGGIGFVSYRMMESRFVDVLHKDTLDAATLLSSRVRNELRHVAEKARILSSAALEEFRNPEDQMRFLTDNLTFDDQFVAMTLFRRSDASQGKWHPVFRLTRPESDPAHLGDEDFKQLELKYPLDYASVGKGATEVTVGNLRDGTPILRMGIPLVRKKGGSFSQLLGIEVRQERITAAFADSTAHFSFILDRYGRVLSQTDPTHFNLGEDLSHLPILMMAQATEAPNGNLDYYEVPGAPLQYGSFHKVGFADLTVVTQAPQTQVTAVLRDYTRQAVFMGFACAFVTLCLSLLVCWGVIGLRLGRIGRTLKEAEGGKFDLKFKEADGEDEIADFARTLQQVCDTLCEREKNHGTHAKMRFKRAREWLDSKPNLAGERGKAFVLCCHLRDLEKMASVADADPVASISMVNEFYKSACALIEAQGGIVDHVHAGSIVAFWGVPIAADDDADRALYTALRIRELVHALDETLKKRHFSPIRLSMGLSCGNVIAGEIGSPDRREYTLVGEAVEVASRIQSFTDQFGTDILLTGNVARSAPEWYSLEQVSAGDADSPELYECVASARTGNLPSVDEGAVPVTSEEPLSEVTSPEAAPVPVVPEPEQAVAEPSVSEVESAEPHDPIDIRTRKRKRRTTKNFGGDDSDESAA